MRRTAMEVLIRENKKVAMRMWEIRYSPDLLVSLRNLTEQFGFRVATCDVILLNSKWYVTHTGLIRLSHRKQCRSIQVSPAKQFCDPKNGRWVFRAVVYKRGDHQGFVGYGDADPSNISAVVRGAELRTAETRSVNRALRKAYGIGICSVEELGSSASTNSPLGNARKASRQSTDGNPKLRDLLCQLIRLHRLDPNLVKAYAVDFCGTRTLREASREQVKAFVAHLSDWATKDRDALLC